MVEPVNGHRRDLVRIQVAGTPLAEADHQALSELRVEQSLHAADAFSLRFNDHDLELVGDARFGLGAVVEISINTEGVFTPVIVGEVTSLTADLDALDQQQFVVAGLDRRHRLARGVKIRTFVNVTDSDVVRKIAGEHGLSIKSGATTTTYDYLLQCGTDYDFIGERARLCGFDWWVDDRTLHFQKPTGQKPVQKVTWGATLRRFRLRLSAAESAGEAVVRGWDPANQQALVGTAPMSAGRGGGLATDAPLVSQRVPNGARTFGAKRFAWGTGVKDAGEATALATAIAQQATSEQAVARGEALGNPALRPGVPLQIDGLAGSLCGTYQLSRVEHVLVPGRSYVTRFESGGDNDHTLVDLLGAGHRPAGASSPPLLGSSLVVGIVTSRDDPDKLGRVKVKFPGLADDHESGWARIVSTGAGPKRGLQIIPDVKDEVLVGFEHGDVRRPLVLGGLWSAKHANPVHAANGKDGAVWQTRSGHLMTMSDSSAPGESYIRIGLKTGKTMLRMGEDESSLEVEKDLTIDGKGKVTIRATGDVLVEGMGITVKAKARLVLEGQSGVDIKSNGPVNVEGAVASVKGKGTATLESGGVTQVKGAMVKVG
jgi:phage protein D/phage baseplate assembly protein gpV